jgi:alkylresorcinol/alkylpyrone synthase
VPEIVSVSRVEMPFRISQNELKTFAREIFSESYPDIDRILESFDNTLIEYRNMAVPLSYFKNNKSFREKNDLYIELALKYSVEAIEECLLNSDFKKEDLTDIIFISSTGISTPSPDGLIVNKMKLNPVINRLPVWGLGCAGGVSGISKALTIAKANPEAVIMLVSAELCSLTFIRDDYSKSNLIATGLFSDGVSAVLIAGDNIKKSDNVKINILGFQSKLYYDTLDVMGWEVIDSGFKVIFSRDIPSIVHKYVKDDILGFLNKYNLKLGDVKNFIVHPGGKKVIDSYSESLNLEMNNFSNTIEVLKNYGNMSSATVLYVLKEFMNKGFQKGYGLMLSLGPGFSVELALLEIK